MFRLVVFDWDGTLIDSQARIVHAMARAFEAHGLDAPAAAAVHEVIGLDLAGAIRRLDPQAAALVPGIEDAYRQAWARAAAVPAPLFEGAIATLEALAAEGLLLAVATGKSRSGLDAAMAETGVRRFFDATRTAEETVPKPHPAMLNELLEELGVAPGEALMVGDTAFDLDMARRAGVRGAAATYGAHERARLLDLRPFLVLDALAELPAALRGASARSDQA